MWGRRAAAFAAIAGLVLVGAGCGGDDDDDATDATVDPTPSEEVCADVATVQTTIDGFGSATSVDEVETNFDNLRTQISDLQESAAGLASETKDELSAAVDGVRTSIEDIPDAATVSDAIDSIQAAVTDLTTAWGKVTEGLNCS